MLFFSFLDLLLHHLFQPYLLHIVQVIFFYHFICLRQRGYALSLVC